MRAFPNVLRNAFERKLFIVLLSLIFLFGPKAFSEDSSKKIKIVTSVFPLMEFAGAVVGERGEVSLLLPPGAEIHTWQPRPSDIVRLSSADLFVYIGSDMEPWLDDLLAGVRNPGLKTLEASQGISLIEMEAAENFKQKAHEQEHEHGAVDPHIWLDFQNDQVIVDRIAAVLSEMDPSGVTDFKKNALAYKKKLQVLDETYMKGLKGCVHKVFIFGGHAAFGYLARRYGLQQVSLYGLSPDSQPTPKKLIEVVELAKKYNVKAIFFESYVSNELASVLAREVKARTLALNPGANLSKEELKSGVTFFDIMERNLENLKDGLICR